MGRLSSLRISVAFLTWLNVAESLLPNPKVWVNHTDLLRLGCKEGSCCVFFYLLKFHCFGVEVFFHLQIQESISNPVDLVLSVKLS